MGDLGAVLFALRLRRGEHGILSGLYERDSASGEWAELALDGNPWFDEGFVPVPYEPGEPPADCVAVAVRCGDGAPAVMRVAGRVVEGVEELHVRVGDRDIACELGTGGAFIALMVIDPGSPPPPLLVRRGALEERVETGR